MITHRNISWNFKNLQIKISAAVVITLTNAKITKSAITVEPSNTLGPDFYWRCLILPDTHNKFCLAKCASMLMWEFFECDESHRTTTLLKISLQKGTVSHFSISKSVPCSLWVSVHWIMRFWSPSAAKTWSPLHSTGVLLPRLQEGPASLSKGCSRSLLQAVQVNNFDLEWYLQVFERPLILLHPRFLP